jgi:3'(2'), 5'-bisphosphate nucleotidase
MPPAAANPDTTALRLAAVAVEAGRLLRRLEAGTTHGRMKQDGTPSTQADLEAELLIIARVKEIFPGVPVIAEETANAVPPDEVFFLIDPLDGTGDYLRGTGEYTVNIALLRRRRPVAAAVFAPAQGWIWAAGESARAGRVGDEGGLDDVAWQGVAARPAPERGLIALVSRRHSDEATEACLSGLAVGSRRSASSALKFCLIASGEADVYVRCGPTMEWDTAAGDHILCRAGGCVIGPGGAQLTYGHVERGYRNGPFAALGDVSLAPRLTLPAFAAAEVGVSAPGSVSTSGSVST